MSPLGTDGCGQFTAPCAGQRWNWLQDVLYPILEKFGGPSPWIPHVNSDCIAGLSFGQSVSVLLFVVTNAAGDKCCSFQGREVHHVQASNLFFFYFRGLKTHK